MESSLFSPQANLKYKFELWPLPTFKFILSPFGPLFSF
jgi:hypothetical protein